MKSTPKSATKKQLSIALARLEQEMSHPANADIRDKVMKRVRRATKCLKTR